MPAGGPNPARRDGQRGVSAVEFAGWLPILLLVALTGLQLGFVGYAAQQAGSAARAAARVAAQEEIADRYRTAGLGAMSDWSDGSVSLDTACGRNGGVATVTASVRVPSVLPFISGFGAITKTVTMPCD
ncbi:TadE family protein [Streptomyces sp. SM12]|uniref:TadE family protein n=1 Tax=Streptomyces sp. SM12 TaxID=1071602 RepID=UPI000CD55586